MSGYFARLVQRASGMEQQTHAAPSPHAAPAASVAHDPFESVAPLEPSPAPSLPLISHSERQEPIAPLVSPVSQDLPVPALAPPGTPLIAPRVASEHAAPPQPIVPNIPSLAEDRIVSPKSDARQGTGTPPLLEHTLVEHEITREILQPVAHVPLPVAPPTPLAEVPKHDLEKPPARPEKLAPPPRPSALLPPHEAPEMLRPIEPMKTERNVPPAPAAIPREEPRLVIGRIQVEVVPTAPGVPPKPRSGSRMRVPSRETAAPSRLHFGLGQM
jgi:hypothetical protein